MPTSTPSLIATAGRRIARWAPAAILTLLACAGCNGDGMPAPPASPWAHSGVVHRALADGVTLGAVIIDRVQFDDAANVEVVQQDPVAHHAAWVELVNPGNEAVRMAGFGLSDQKSQPFKWVFPADAVLVAGGRVRVWLVTGSDAAATVLVTAPNGTAAGVLLDSTHALRHSVHAAWCRRSSNNSNSGNNSLTIGPRFGPCVAETAALSDGRHQALAGLATQADALSSRE